MKDVGLGEPTNAWKDTANWQIRRPNNDAKSRRRAWMTITSKKNKWDQLENCQKYHSQIVVKCLYVARIGRLDILWSVNKLARSIKKWTKACDKRSSCK